MQIIRIVRVAFVYKIAFCPSIIHAGYPQQDIEEEKVQATVEALTCNNGREEWEYLRAPIVQEVKGESHLERKLIGTSENLWVEWFALTSTQGSLLAPGSLSLANRVLGEDDPYSDYCLGAHVAAGFYAARYQHLKHAFNDLNDGNMNLPWDALDIPLPDYVVQEMDQTLLQTIMLFGHNRALDFLKLAGWPVGAAEILEVRDALRRACSREVEYSCTVLEVEREILHGLAQSVPLHYFKGLGITPLPFEWNPPTQEYVYNRAQSSRQSFKIRVWYLGVHESLYKEVSEMWLRYPDQFEFEFARVNKQGMYNPSANLEAQHLGYESSNKEVEGRARSQWQTEKLNFRYMIEDILDIQPAARKFRYLLNRRDRSDVDATILLCTIPAFACSAFLGIDLPVVMYAANPLTAQVPSEQYLQWIARFADMAADPKNQLLVSNTWSHAQFEYQTGISFPVIRVHGLYTNAHHRSKDVGSVSPQTLVYDRSNPLLTRVLNALRRNANTTAGSIIHQVDTDRSYQTFATFDSVVFVPGDVEQMAFYEFYSMELPVFVPSNPGRYMWQRLPEQPTHLDATCGDYASWAGTWQMSPTTTVASTYIIDCEGNVEVPGIDAGKLKAREKMDNHGFTHCVDSLLGVHMRFRLTRILLQAIQTEGGILCDDEISTEVPVRIIDGERTSEEPIQPKVWDHDIFASSIWYLDARLPGPKRWKYSPFSITSLDAVWEWARYMDYFRFPAVGLFASMPELLSNIGSRAKLNMMSEKMRAFNERTLKQSTTQWESVIMSAVMWGRT